MKLDRNILFLHCIIFIWGWTAVLGKIITLPALQLIWLRTLLALSGIILFVLYRRNFRMPGKKITFQLLGIGLVIALHWMCFYGAVKVSNVSVTLACFSTGTLFTSLLEPIFFRRKVLWYEILFGLVVIGALLLIFNAETEYALGMALGIGAALTSSFMAVLNGIMIRKNMSAGVVSVLEMLGALAFLSLFIFLLQPESATLLHISMHDWFYLFILSLGCTTVPFMIGVLILKKISPYTMSLTLNLETIYGILFAFFIFKDSEYMSVSFYISTTIILAVVFADSYIKRYVQ